MPIGVPERRDVVFTQRSGDNLNYEEVHASGSNLLFYTDTDGRITAAKTSSFLLDHTISSSWSSQSLSSSLAQTSSYCTNTTCSRVVGAGVNYTLTLTSTRVTFSVVSPDIILPEAGTYFVIAKVQFIGATGTTGDEVRAKIRNITNNVDITPDQDSLFQSGGSDRILMTLADVTTVTGSVTASIFAYNDTAARGTISSSKTSINYIKLR